MIPVISVIIATYNAAKTLRCCLESIVKQKNEYIELLVIDGGSSDGTQDILDEYRSQINLIISEPDNGIYDAWNKGIVHARGEWILFIGADDTLESDAFFNYLKFLNTQDTTKVDYICAKNTYLGRDGNVIKIMGIPWLWEQFRQKMDVAHVASLHHRDLFQENGMFDLRFPICGDYELLLRKRNKLRCLFLDTCIARMTTGGASFTMLALWEAHQIRKLHSGYSTLTLIAIYIWQIILFQRHKLLN
ncbi:MAG: glycosyltransferase family 2 protein [Pedobacter sp.]